MTEENAWAGQGSVLLDIGGDVGAVIVQMPAELVGSEVEIRPLGWSGVHEPDHGHGHGHGHGEHRHLPHVAVVDRPVMGPTLVFGEVVEGQYELCPKGTDDVRLAVRVHGGQVTTLEWPG